MWRQNAFPGNLDSDQSISDEEVCDVDFGDNWVSFGGRSNTEKREGLLLQNRLEMITGDHELEFGRKAVNLAHEAAEDEVEMPEFPDEVDLNFFDRDTSKLKADEERISDDEDNVVHSRHSTSSSTRFGLDGNLRDTIKQDRGEKCFKLNKEAEPLKHLTENALSYYFSDSKATKFCNGIRRKAKLKFPLHPYPCSENVGLISKDGSSSKIGGVSERVERAVECEAAENLNPEEEDKFEVGEVRVSREESSERLEGTKLQDSFYEKKIQHRGYSKMPGSTRERTGLTSKKKTKPLLVEKVIEGEYLDEPMISTSSSDDGADHEKPKPMNADMRRETMTDRFQEALAAGTSSSNEADFATILKPSSTGLFAKLQKVMLSEKQKDADFQKNLHLASVPYGEPSSIVVKILSRCLDAKLTVCQCSIGKPEMGSRFMESSQATECGRRSGTTTAIFSPRVCNDVDLEVGNYICIHPPWGEIKDVDNYNSIMLATYFSPVSL